MGGAMMKQNLIYLAAGIILGIVIGFLVFYMVFQQKGDIARPQETAQQPSMGGMQPPEHIDIMKEIESLKALVQKDQSNYEALVRLGNLYFDAVKFPQASEYYSKAIAINDSDPNVITDLGICYRNSGDPKKNPSHWQSYYNIVIVSLNDLQDIAAAEKAFQELEKIKPDMEGIEMMRKQIEMLKEKKLQKEATS
jgi:tetratricopeptide (TPR) repeat protein